MNQSLNHLQLLNEQLDNLHARISAVVAAESWQQLSELDQRVNALVHQCVQAGQMQDPAIHSKVMSVAQLYRQVIERLQQEKAALHQQWQKHSNSQKAQAVYASGICA
ncbi:hypothetical protein [Halioxenophilus sp. WMMB6]|uniref:hypothetical protein n=1 Tax=Halioxenophilus sp. WMMB6 TaxID=3073815 RepID=UPI00295E64A5|nr:hypothetical protein [Halioxenophilus sp. WMMB6]